MKRLFYGALAALALCSAALQSGCSTFSAVTGNAPPIADLTKKDYVAEAGFKGAGQILAASTPVVLKGAASCKAEVGYDTAHLALQGARAFIAAGDDASAATALATVSAMVAQSTAIVAEARTHPQAVAGASASTVDQILAALAAAAALDPLIAQTVSDTRAVLASSDPAAVRSALVALQAENDAAYPGVHAALQAACSG